MPAPQNAALPPFFTLENGYIVRVSALDPTDGSTVTGVVASNVSIAVDAGDVASGPTTPPLSPSFLPA